MLIFGTFKQQQCQKFYEKYPPIIIIIIIIIIQEWDSNPSIDQLHYFCSLFVFQKHILLIHLLWA